MDGAVACVCGHVSVDILGLVEDTGVAKDGLMQFFILHLNDHRHLVHYRESHLWMLRDNHN